MPSVGTIAMVSPTPGQQPGGGAFLLIAPPTKDRVYPLTDGEIEIRTGVPFIVARTSPASDDATAFSRAHSLVQRGLDMLSILGVYDGAIRDAEDEHLIWWTSQNGLVLRVVSTSALKFTVPPATLTVRDKAGNIVPQPAAAPPGHHPSFRFFRLAQTTDDLFDAYRNMYLAFEALLSSQFPKQKGEREIDWLVRGLTQAVPALQLGALHPLRNSTDVVKSIIDLLYYDARLPLFHAKDGQAYYAPHDDPADRAAVAEALSLLTQIVLRMSEGWFGARRIGGGVYFGWVYATVRNMAANFTACASNYEGAFDPAEDDVSHHRFAAGARMQTRLAPELERRAEPAILSVAAGGELGKANPLRRVDLINGNAPYAAHLIEAPVDLQGVTQLEALMHVRATNVNQPRSLFRR